MEILIAEDEDVDRELLVAALQQLGHGVVVTENGRQAWEIFQQREDLRMLISDWLMPEVDGLELCRRVRVARRPHYTYVVLLTIMSGKSRYMEGMDAGADDFISKPFDPDLLAARLRVAERILNLHQEVRQLESLLPICSYCKKIRDERERWWPIEKYIGQRTATDFSHGICPECYANIAEPDLERWKKERR